ncbi:hypothetical protein BDY19DRAFT_928059 [Irpex rosettiformis]|uniref:Uncharacterized protein n=1 Tax=Irpex rosettiformis TaxID=378272 RepID=A0ACB8UCY4_9APHY|nr:hypothetical protein BDY19DRAFT_928059 [Irpex rosettiformis]
MLSHSTPSKSRPIPPARMRRARTPSLPIHPPPPYAPPGSTDMILNSPVSVTSQLISTRSPDVVRSESSITSAVEEWMNEKSRVELSNLLVAAGDIIKSRETELGLTSTLCKNLYQENYTLKTKHDALLARIPSRDDSPPGSPPCTLSPLPSSDSAFTSDSRPNSPEVESPIRHIRRVSVTTGELSLLSDQNAELLDKLEKLEEESAHADLAGKRKLRKLEKEIAGLRAELEKTREKGEELEQNMKKRGIGLTTEEEEEARRKREEREERLRLLKEKSGLSSSRESSLQDIKDFAPAPELPRVRARTLSHSKAPIINLGTKPIAQPPIPEDVPLPISTPICASASGDSYFPMESSISGSSLSSTQSTPQLEYALISQLLAKIRELEDTNSQIASEQKSTADRLLAAQRDAETLRRAYECLGDGASELQIITEDIEEESETSPSTPLRNRVVTGTTVKFSSLRRSIGGDISRLGLTDDFSEDIPSGFMKQDSNGSMLDLDDSSPLLQKGKITSQKPRKSIVALFDVQQADQNRRPAYPSRLTVSPGFRALSPIPFPKGLADNCTWSAAGMDSLEETHSPSSSPGSPSPSVYASPLLNLTSSNLDLLSSGPSLLGLPNARGLHSLGSELGSEFGEDWGSGNHHLRATSIGDMSAFWNRDNSVVGTPSSPSTAPEFVLLSASTSPLSDSVWEDVDESPRPAATSAASASASASGTEVGTPTKSRHPNGLQLQLVIEPATPIPSEVVKASPPFRSSPLGASVSTSTLALSESRSSRNLRLSQTVRARTNRWVERVEKRYQESPGIPDDEPSSAIVRKRRPLLGLQKRQRNASTALDDTFEEVAQAISRSFSGSSIEYRRFSEEVEIDGDSGSALRHEVVGPRDDILAMVSQKKKQGFVGFVLEVWLWLQFAIVVCVFLWAMARRGPKSVLEDAERRRVEMQRSSRR